MSDSLTYILLILTYLGRPYISRGEEKKNKKKEKNKKGKKKKEGKIEKKKKSKNIFSLAYTLYLLTIYI